MAPYTYEKLDRNRDEIRLMRLLPGAFDDEIACEIFHSPLPPAPSVTQSFRMSLEEIRKTLPNPQSSVMGVTSEEIPHGTIPDPEIWSVGETLGGSYIFFHDGTLNSAVPSTFEHPVPGFDRSFYIQPPPPEYEPDFEALSYVWGSPLDPVTARIFSETSTEPKSTLSIGQNLALTLRHLRFQDRPRTLWVDAVCINQNDIDERNTEVKRMKDIYSLARRTVIWLGEESENSTLALDTLRHFGTQVEIFATETEIRQGDCPGATMVEWFKPNCPLPYDEATWRSIEAILRRSWFERVWVLQEALLSGPKAVVQCGRTIVPWVIIQKSIIALQDREMMPPTLNEVIRAYCSGITPSGGQIGRRLLIWGRGRQCTDPRDRVYGILGLLSDRVRDMIGVDYTKPVSYPYIAMIKAEVEISKLLGFLKECSLGCKKPGMPSWVPNLSLETANRYESRSMYQRWHSATLNSAAAARFVDPDVLEVEGVLCGIVSSLGPRASETPADRLKSFIAWQTLTAQLTRREETVSVAQLDACLYVLLGGFVKRSVVVDLAEVRSLYLRALAGDAAAFDALVGFMNISYPINDTGMYFLTDTGYVGLGPEEVQPGDHVCSLLGSRFIELLRPGPSVGNSTVVGPCIVGGLMSGESLRGPLPEPWTMSWAGHHESGDYKGHYIAFRNSASGETSLDDPRIPQLATYWGATRDMKMPSQTGWYHNCYRNKQTGQVENFDPTLFPQALRDRGVNIEVFRLV
ncbi:heterokaryon incompatibility protein-domain-containing protein [Xylaria scruposa]|nr:heterokaryon incompatibility protein-domain-containing protein [Xylaria scruposa]